MRVRLGAILTAAAMVLLPVVSSAQAEKKFDATGKWLFSVVTDNGTGTPTVTMKQSGDTLSGHYSSQTLGEVDFKGTVKDKKVTFTLNVDMQGTALTLTYSATADTNDTLKGTVDFGGMGSGTFTAKRQ